jgi:uncharacterized membrane protein YphA (DoxX/SURF4 family)
MHGFLWLLQIVLAIVFAASGAWKLARGTQAPPPALAWVGDHLPERVRLIGLVEVLAAVALVLPGWTGGLTWLTPLAATVLVVLMALVTLFHYRRGEQQLMAVTGALGLLALLVAAFRFGPYAW